MEAVAGGWDRELLSDVALLNGILGDGLSFAVERERATAILVLADQCGSCRQASRRLRLTPGRRPRWLALSACLAECAMDLGLGVSICRREVRESS